MEISIAVQQINTHLSKKSDTQHKSINNYSNAIKSIKKIKLKTGKAQSIPLRSCYFKYLSINIISVEGVIFH